MKDSKSLNFDPDAPYTINEAARICGQTADWLQRHAIKTGKLQSTPMGNSKVIMGRWITDYVIANGTFEGDENCPESKRGKHRKSPLKKTDDDDGTS